MSVTRHAVLNAIAQESAERRGGPAPAHLIPIAVNAKSQEARNQVETTMLTLRTEGLLSYRRDPRYGNGVKLTAAGHAALSVKGKVPRRDPARPAHQPTPAPPPAVAPSIDPELVDPATQPELFTLLCDVGSLISEGLARALEDADLEEAARMQRLGLQVLRHVGERP